MSTRRLRRRLWLLLGRLRRNDQILLSCLALVVGALAGGGAILFLLLIGGVQMLAFGFAHQSVHTGVGALPWWRILAAPALGGLLVGLCVHYLLPGRRAPGVADVIKAATHDHGRMSLGGGLGAALVSAVSIGSGASVGREGPMVHLGATLASKVARGFGLGPTQAVALLGCGVAAGVAASFNAPLAGVLFALEVVVGHYSLTAFAPAVIASVTGTLISRIVYGDAPAFAIPEHAIRSVWEFPAFALLGVVAAATALIFMATVMAAQDGARRLPGPAWLRPAVGGLLVGCVAIVFPQVLGVGYEATSDALRGSYGLALLLALLVAKTATTAISLGSGFGGGVFSPSLVVGALVGGAFGIVASSVFPELSSGTGAYTVVGMGAVAGAVLGAPISTILIVFELTANYSLTLGVMVAMVIATVIVQQVLGRSFFTWQLDRWGVRPEGARERSLLRTVSVRQVMDGDCPTVPPDATLDEARTALMRAPDGVVLVVDGDGRLQGRLAFSDLLQADGAPAGEARAVDVARRDPPAVLASDDLGAAFAAFDATDERHLPVLADRESRRLVGLLHERDVILAYNRALLHARAEEHGETPARGFRPPTRRGGR